MNNFPSAPTLMDGIDFLLIWFGIYGTQKLGVGGPRRRVFEKSCDDDVEGPLSTSTRARVQFADVDQYKLYNV